MTGKNQKEGKVKTMKKGLKRILALLVSFVMVFAMATTVFAESDSPADTGYKIQIVGQTESSKADILGNTYSVYKIADFNVSGNVYTDIQTVAPFTGLQDSLTALAGKAYDSTEAVTFAERAAACIGSVTAVGTLTVTDTNNELDVPSTGYYLVVDTAHGASNPYLTTKYLLVAVDGLDNALGK